MDNVMIVAAIMEQNRYLKTNTYLVLTDAEECFENVNYGDVEQMFVIV